ncbi:MAG: ABC transporter permease [Promethearchaeota archaeon]
MNTATEIKTTTTTKSAFEMNSEISTEFTVDKVKIGAKRGLIQIKKTIDFEFLRNAKKFMSMLLTSAGIFLLFLIINLISEDQGALAPEDPAEYFQSYLTMTTLLVLIIATTFFGSIIAEDFEKQTGNLLFPKIPKERLLIGRIIARYTYAFLSVAFYYLLVAITTYLKYDGVPKIVWGSMLWAELYLFGLMAFMTLLSSLFKRSSTAMITGILGILIVFQLFSMIFMFTGITAEPFYFITYYGNIITVWFNMPAVDARYVEMGFGHGPAPPELGDATYYQWLTPSAEGAIIGVAIYSIVCFTIAYLLYRRRQN